MTRMISAGVVALFVIAGFATLSAQAAGAGDPKKGEDVYNQCMACHAIAYDVVGPRHAGLFGRKAGSLPDYDYSPAMKKSGVVWNAKTLDAFIKDPQKFIPGTKMPFGGIADDQERADLIAYMEIATKVDGK